MSSVELKKHTVNWFYLLVSFFHILCQVSSWKSVLLTDSALPWAGCGWRLEDLSSVTFLNLSLLALLPLFIFAANWRMYCHPACFLFPCHKYSQHTTHVESFIYNYTLPLHWISLMNLLLNQVKVCTFVSNFCFLGATAFVCLCVSLDLLYSKSD